MERPEKGVKLSPEKPERKLEGKGESEEASAENESDGRRKEIADEACMKLRVLRSDPKPQFRVRWIKSSYPLLAQLVEQLTLNQWVPGSSP